MLKSRPKSKKRTSFGMMKETKTCRKKQIDSGKRKRRRMLWPGLNWKSKTCYRRKRKSSKAKLQKSLRERKQSNMMQLRPRSRLC